MTEEPASSWCSLVFFATFAAQYFGETSLFVQIQKSGKIAKVQVHDLSQYTRYTSRDEALERFRIVGRNLPQGASMKSISRLVISSLSVLVQSRGKRPACFQTVSSS